MSGEAPALPRAVLEAIYRLLKIVGYGVILAAASGVLPTARVRIIKIVV